MIYLDNSATTQVYDEVIKVMTEVMKKDYGNPSSLHTLGLNAEKVLKNSREEIAKVFSADKNDIVFTSGGTESNNLGIYGGYSAKKRESNRIITTRIEHPSVLETIKGIEKEEGAEVVYIDVDQDSILDLDAFNHAIQEGAALVSIMAVNNETGALMPLCHIRDGIEAAGKNGAVKPVFHCDGVQGLCKEDISTIPADLISVSSHKIHGPKGVGALCIKNGRINPMMLGGGQERGLRSGTENMPGIAGFAAAARIGREEFKNHREHFKALNALLRKGIEEEIKDIRINSSLEGTPSILNVSFFGTRGEVLLHALEQEGIMVSTGAACSSGKNARKSGSHVLKAMGLSQDVIEGAIRFSFGAFNTLEEIPLIVDRLKESVNRFRKIGTFR